MRWIYFNDNPQEAAEREAIVARIDAWWRAFEGKVDDLRAHFKGKARWDLPQWMDDNLHPIHPKIMWEYGPAVRIDGHRLVLTPESAHELRPLVAKILERAPSIPGWEFYDARLPEDLESTKATVEGRAAYDIHDFLVRVSVSEKRLIDLCYYSPRIESAEDQAIHHTVLIAAAFCMFNRPRDLAPGGPGRLQGVRGSAGRDRVRADRLQQVPGRLEAAVKGRSRRNGEPLSPVANHGGIQSIPSRGLSQGVTWCASGEGRP